MARPSNILVSTIKRNQRLRGPTSSEQQNDMQAEVVRDLTVYQQEWNNKVVPLCSILPDGTDDLSIDAFLNGLDGRTMYVHAAATNAAATVRFFNLIKDRPNTVYEQFLHVYDFVTNLGEEILTGRTLEAGAGLTGGGNLSADLTFAVGTNADGSIVVNADDIQVGVLATDAQHGTRGGGTQHAVFNSTTAGFAPASGGGTVNFLRADGSFALPPTFTSSANGYAPSSGGGSTNFLRADGTWAVPPGTATGTVDGSGSANQLAVWVDSNTIAGDADLTFDGATLALSTGSLQLPITTLSADTTLSASHYTARIDATGATRTITLPAASGCTGRIYNIKKIDSSTNLVIIDANSTELIEGQPTLTLVSQFDIATVQSNGTGWDLL